MRVARTYTIKKKIKAGRGAGKTDYRYNGKELQRETNYIDYGARQYDPQIGRWHVQDPMGNLYYNTSPYAYVRNNPILRIDPNGMWDVEVHVFHDREKYGYGTAIVRDRHGNEVYRFQVRAQGSGGANRMVKNSDTPLGVYDIPDKGMWIGGGSRKSYGPNSRLVLNGESGEIAESGRSDIRIHGGRQEVYNKETGKWEKVSNPKLKKTHGCLRSFDDDIKKMKEITDNLQANDKEEFGGKLTIIDDLVEQDRNYVIPDQSGPEANENKSNAKNKLVIDIPNINPVDNTYVAPQTNEIYNPK